MSDLRESLTQSGTLYGFINTIVYAHDYTDLTNKPQINGVTLIGNKTASELGLVTPATEAVQSVNGETGAVVLDGNDIAYDSHNTINQQIDAVAASIDYPVTSVNEKTGDVVLDGTDISFDGTYNLVQKIEAVEAEIPAVPVQSVNGEIGHVVLDGDDIAYNSSLSVNQKIDDVESSIPVVNYPVTSVNEKTGDVVIDDTDIEHSSGVSVNSIINTIVQYTPVYGNTASGAIATFDTSLALPLQDCTIAINAVQESGTPTPSSPKLISGFTGANIYVKGSNLWNEVWEVGTINNSTGADSPSNDTWRSVGYIPVTPSTAYYVVNTRNVSLRYYFYDINKTFISSNTVGNSVLTTTDKTFYMRIRSVLSEGATYTNNVSINYPATDTAYHAYNANSTTTAISWQDEAGTIYGGSLDVTSGVLTVTWTKKLMSTWTWSYNNTSYAYGFFYLANDISDKASNMNALAECFVNNGNGRNALSDNELGFWNNTGGINRFCVRADSIANLTAWNTFIADKYVAYELATPVTYQLTPTQISAIVGTNNVFTDTNGNTSVVYACSLKDYIDIQ